MSPEQPAALDARGAAGAPAHAEAYLSIRGVDKRYGEITALESASLECTEGELVTLLGPSGSGKSTLLRVIAGLDEPDTGDVLLGGSDLLAVPPHRRDVGVVFQNYALFPNMTAFDNVRFPLRMRRQKDVAEKVGEALRLVGLEGRESAKPRQLSGGQQQRVALARAIVFGPRLLLLDEPLSALDRQLRSSLQFELRQLQRRVGVTTINVTHDQEEALHMSDRIAVMRDGRILQVGTPEQIYQEPATLFVATFLGSSNTLYGTFVSEDGRTGIRVATDVTIWGRRAAQATAAVVRAESLSLTPRHAPPPAEVENCLDGVVKDIAFEGPTVVARVAVPAASAELTARVPVREFEPATEVRVSWRASETLLLHDGT